MDKFISVRGAKENNLKNINVDIPKNNLVVITGPSGSGKSSLAFDTIYAEGQRRYVESLSSYARQFLNLQSKPDVESIVGLSPAIAIDQKTTSRNPRSTVGTVTEIYDYMRLLFARIGIPYSPATGLPIESQTASDMVQRILEFPLNTKIYLLAPITKGQKGEHTKEILALKKQGYQRIKVNGTIYEIDEMPKLDRNKKNEIEVVVDRIKLAQDLGNRLADSVETVLKISEGLLHVEVVELPENIDRFDISTGKVITIGDVITFSEKFSCPVSGFSIDEIEPRMFSFNSPYGACDACGGLGTEVYFMPEFVVPDPSLSLSEEAIMPWRQQSKFYMQILQSLSVQYDFSMETPYEQLPDKIKHIILYGTGEEEIKINYSDGFKNHAIKRPFEGVINNLNQRWRESDSEFIREELEKYQSLTKCRKCEGFRLKQESLLVKIDKLHIGQVSDLSITDAKTWFSTLMEKLSAKHQEIADRVIKEIYERLGFLDDVGLEYLTLSRESGTLSGGESQRIRLASQIGSGLSGVMYVLDEPSIGLHQSDNDKLIHTLKNLRDLGNTVIVVEHDEETMLAADYLIDIGPGAGEHGGEVIACGTVDEVRHNPNSITGAFLSGRNFIEVPPIRRKMGTGECIEIINARGNNLKNLNVKIPLGLFVAITGVSGGGKSTLVIHTLYKAIAKKLNGSNFIPALHDEIKGLDNIDKIIEIDQSPIGRTPRSNPATYTAAFSHIRDWFANLPESKARGYKVGRFSFNMKGGRCETCQGDGVIKIEMHFLPDVYITCDACKGKRYNRETLEVQYKGKSIADVLNMTVEEALHFFQKIPVIKEKIKSLFDVGLGYMKIGQSATTLSGGEAQRIKLSKELCKKATGNTLYILDEPTTGLHSSDIKRLLNVLHTLVDYGNSMIVIEHNMDVIKTADHVIDIGPKGGILGGQIVASGTPEQIVANEKSVTGKYLKKYLP